MTAVFQNGAWDVENPGIAVVDNRCCVCVLKAGSCKPTDHSLHKTINHGNDEKHTNIDHGCQYANAHHRTSKYNIVLKQKRKIVDTVYGDPLRWEECKKRMVSFQQVFSWYGLCSLTNGTRTRADCQLYLLDAASPQLWSDN